MYFFPSEDVLLNEIFYQYTKRFSEKVEKVISNSNIITTALINKKEKNLEGSPSSSMKSNKSSESEDEDGNNGEVKNKKIPVKKIFINFY